MTKNPLLYASSMVIVAILALCSSCGSDDDGGASPTEETSPTEDTSPPPKRPCDPDIPPEDQAPGVFKTLRDADGTDDGLGGAYGYQKVITNSLDQQFEVTISSSKWPENVEAVDEYKASVGICIDAWPSQDPSQYRPTESLPHDPAEMQENPEDFDTLASTDVFVVVEIAPLILNSKDFDLTDNQSLAITYLVDPYLGSGRWDFYTSKCIDRLKWGKARLEVINEGSMKLWLWKKNAWENEEHSVGTWNVKNDNNVLNSSNQLEKPGPGNIDTRVKGLTSGHYYLHSEWGVPDKYPDPEKC